MPQEFQVLQCYKCQTFQVHQVKKVTKWACKLCAEKQSIKKVYSRGSGADCRHHVQRLNTHRGTLEFRRSAGVQTPLQSEPEQVIWPIARGQDGVDAYVDPHEPQASKWGAYVDDEGADGLMDDDDETDDPRYTTNAGDLHGSQRRRKKRCNKPEYSSNQSSNGSKWRKYGGDGAQESYDEYTSTNRRPENQLPRTYHSDTTSRFSDIVTFPQSRNQTGFLEINNPGVSHLPSLASEIGDIKPGIPSNNLTSSSFVSNSWSSIGNQGTETKVNNDRAMGSDVERVNLKKAECQNLPKKKRSLEIEADMNNQKTRISRTKWDSFIDNSESSIEDSKSQGASGEINCAGDYSTNTVVRNESSSTMRPECSVQREPFKPPSQESSCTSSKGDNSQADEFHGILNTSAKFPDMRPYVSFDDLEACALQEDRCIISPTNQKFTVKDSPVCRSVLKTESSSKWAAFAQDNDKSLYINANETLCCESLSDKENCAQQLNILRTEDAKCFKVKQGNEHSEISLTTSKFPGQLINDQGMAKDQHVTDGIGLPCADRNVILDTANRPGRSIETGSLFNIGELADDDFDL